MQSRLGEADTSATLSARALAQGRQHELLMKCIVWVSTTHCDLTLLDRAMACRGGWAVCGWFWRNEIRDDLHNDQRSIYTKLSHVCWRAYRLNNICSHTHRMTIVHNRRPEAPSSEMRANDIHAIMHTTHQRTLKYSRLIEHVCRAGPVQWESDTKRWGSKGTCHESNQPQIGISVLFLVQRIRRNWIRIAFDSREWHSNSLRSIELCLKCIM